MTIKKIHFIISLFAMVLGCGNMFAQQLTDPSFENWGGTAFHGSAQLKYWNGSNVKQTYMNFTAYGTMVTQATGARTGSYCAQIQNDKVEALGIGEVAPAWLTLGTPFADISNGISGATAGTYGGIAFTYRPDTMAVWIKRTGGNTADEDINLVYYSWIGSNTETSYMSKSSGCVSIDEKVDEESDIRIRNDKNACATHNSTATQVAEGWLRTRVSYSSWTLIKVPINYYTNDVPQKMNIILSAANYPNFRANSGIYVGNALYVDDISLIYSSKIHELYINNRKWESFSPDVYEYTYALGVGATEIPSISARRSGRVLPTSEVTITNGTVGGSPTIITVKAQDGSSSTTYKIYFVAQQSTNARLAGISVNGTAISNFNSYVTSYNVALPYGTTVVPEIAVTKAEDGQTYEITNCSSLPGTATIKVYAEDKSYSQTYTLNFTVAALTDNTLQDILINNKSLTGFAPTKTTYVVEMPVGTTTDPTITPISAYEAGAQTIVLDNQGLNGKSTIKVTPTGATNTRTYNITYKITESSYSYLKSIKVGGETLPNFAPETTSYTYTLPIGTTSLPEITWEQGDDYQTVTKEEGGIDGVTKITVTAQNGTITIYRITFITLKSSVATLTDLQIDGTTIAGFDGNIFTYNYELPIGTTALPAITWTAGDAYQTINIIKGDINGTTKIIVKAQNGTTNTYNIIFSVAQADNTTLTAITIGGVLIPGFTPTILEYNYVLPRGTTVLPEIGYTQHDEYQTVIVRKGGLDGDTKITVKAQTGVTADYTIHFSVEISSNGLLQNIFVDGMALANFDANQFTYTYELPIGTTTMPAITYLRGDEYQTVTVTEGGLNGITEILVTSEDKLQKNTYRITFSVAQAGVSTLLDLQVGGVTIEGFQPEILEYSYVLPRGTTVLPTITCVAHDAYQTIRQSDNGVNGDAKIIVRAQTGAVSTYVIHFSVEKSNNSQLSDIQLNGVSLEGFESTILNYVDTLTSGTTELPEITVTKGDNYQTVYITKGGVNGTTTIRVVAENGSETIYAIAFSVRKSENAFLKNILIDGIAIAGFDKTLFDYTYILDASAVTCPTITVEKEEGQSVVIIKPNLIGTAMIVVTPEFGANNTYTIKFKLNQSSNTALADLTVGGTTIAGFDPTILNYTYVLPNGTATLPNIGYVVGDVHQAVNIIKGNVDDTTYIHVVAEDGAKALYSIAFSVQKAESAVVNNIMVNGMSLSGFNDTVLNYTYELPKGTLACPTIEVVKAEEGQTVYITKPNLEGTAYITVIPEIGLETVYTIVFAFNRSNNSFLNDLTIDGTTVTNFRSDSLKYTIQLPNGTTELPAVAYTKGEEEQTVAVFSNGVNGTTVVTVKAEDGTVSMYELVFSVVKSTDATLQSLKIDGVVISDFRSDSLYYVYTLPTGTAVCPTIEAVVNHSAQNITVVTPKRDGTGTIIVTAENGTQQIYTVEFVFAPMSNVNLAAITVDNAPLATFDAATINYIVDLPAGASAPNIGFVAADSTQMISIIDMDLNGTQILVTAQNGNQKVYSVTYNVALSDNALLQDLQLYNGSQFVSIADFAADKFNYCDTLAWRTATV
ncbi:MAG: hypothetical protein EOM76_03580, partial [Sphingobacteriia bacterium]|nr:hypothetical protein [Sphingobacteriia bacterium]